MMSKKKETLGRQKIPMRNRRETLQRAAAC
ncbi:BnaA04g14700D [Brassica napus]|uniref:BnaA04g14700D protein n=1 Tax=Brassica napus TaxID=3708 RepID=A0A078I8Y9_BRANA|nr:BnaA04g14700D [Brassica napus]